MSSARNSITSLVTVVVFLVLIAITATLYNGDQEQKTKLEQNFFWQKTVVIFNGALAFLTAPESSSPVETALLIANPQGTEGFWSLAKDKIKEEWDKSDAENLKTEKNISLDSIGQDNFLDWQKTATGAELIFREKSGAEHKLLLPFKFLSR